MGRLLRIAARGAALIFALAGVLTLAHDVVASLSLERVSVGSTGKLWFDLAPESLNLAQAAVQRHIWPPLWDPGIVWLLQWPAWTLLFVIALLLAMASRRKPPRRIFGPSRNPSS